MSIYEYACSDCEIVYTVEKPCERKGEHCICPSCQGLLKYTGHTIHENPEEVKHNNVVHLQDFRLTKKGLI